MNGTPCGAAKISAASSVAGVSAWPAEGSVIGSGSGSPQRLSHESVVFHSDPVPETVTT